MATPEQNLVIENNSDTSFYTTKRNEVPLWDHPFLKGSKVLPKHNDYNPRTSSSGVIDLYKRGIIDDTDIILLKVLGNSVCSNEDQLRRYMSSKMSPSQTSKRLDKFRKYGLADRWKVRIREQEEAVKPPAPFTLGVAGYILMKHLYGDEYFVSPDSWLTYGIGGIKRFVAMNELRCIMTASKVASMWSWKPYIARNKNNGIPLAAAEVKTPKGNVNFIIDRAQMNQDFIGFFKERLHKWKGVYEQHGRLPISEFPDNPTFVIIYTSTLSIAEHIHKEVMLDTFPFHIWTCVEEDLLNDGFSTSFYRPDKGQLKRIKLDF